MNGNHVDQPTRSSFALVALVNADAATSCDSMSPDCATAGAEAPANVVATNPKSSNALDFHMMSSLWIGLRKLQPIKPRRVLGENLALQLHRQIFPIGKRRHRARKLRVPVRVVRREADGVRIKTGDVRQHRFLRFAEEPNSARLDVFARPALDVRHERRAMLVVLVETFEPVRHPADARLEERDAKLRKAFEDAAADDAHRRDHLLERMRDGMGEEIILEPISARERARRRRAMNGKRHAETLGFREDWKVVWMIEILA